MRMRIRTKRFKVRYVALVAAIILALLPLVAAAYDWTQFGYSQQHTSNNTQESIINSGNVSQLQKLFQVALPAGADGAPVYLENTTTAKGVKNLIFVTTTYGHIVAMDADNGSLVWSHQYGPGSCKINNGSTTCYTTSSPALDPNRQYVYSYGLDGYVHKYQVGDGTEIKDANWPQLTSRKPFDEKESSALTVATAKDGSHYLYVAHGGYPGDNGDYQGHLTTINLTTGSQHVFNAICSNQVDIHFYETPTSPDCNDVQTAVWARPSAVYAATIDKIFITTGNGPCPAVGSHVWGESVLELNPDGTGNSGGDPFNSFTPNNPTSCSNLGDADLGSTAPAILPVSGYSNIKYPNLAVQGGKEGILRLLNLDNLNSHGVAGYAGGEISSINVPQGGEVLSEPAVWVDASNKTWVFVKNSNGISGLQLSVDSNGNPTLVKVWQKSGGGVTSPIVANNVLYDDSSNNVLARDPFTGNTLWSNSYKLIGHIHWSSPIVANGVLYVADGGNGSSSGNLTAFSIGGTVPPTTTAGTTSTPPPTTTTTPTPPPGTVYTYAVPFLANNYNSFTTYLSLQNLSGNLASVNIQYYGSDGTALATDANGGLTAYSLWNPAQKLASNQSGAALVTSSQPLNIIVAEATRYGGSAYAVGGSPASSLVSPLAFNGAYGFTTQLTIFNAGSSTNVKVQFYDSNGSHQTNSDQSFTLGAHNLKMIDQTTIGLPAGFNGWAQITGDNGSQLMAQVLEQNPTTHFVAIANATVPASTLVAPAVFKQAFGNFNTGANIVNPNSSAVNVTVTYYNSQGTATTTPTFTIPAYGIQAIFHPGSGSNGLPATGLPLGFAGSALVSANAGIVMVVNEDGGITSTGSRESGVYAATSVGKSALGLPVMSNGAFGGYYTGATIVNISSQPVAGSLQYYDANGNPVGNARTFTIPAYGSKFSFQGGENPALPAGYYGDAIVQVTSGPANSLIATTNALNSAFFYTYAEPAS